MAQRQTFGSFIRELRQERGRTLKEVADFMEWSIVYLSDIERDRRNPPHGEALQRLSLYLDCSLSLMQNIADVQRQRVELDIHSDDGLRANAALTLARRWNDITEEQAQKIVNIFNEQE